MQTECLSFFIWKVLKGSIYIREELHYEIKEKHAAKLLYVNLTMVLVLTILFVSTSGLYARQLARERYNLANITLAKLNKDFQLEMQRLNSLLTPLCGGSFYCICAF